MGSVQTSLLAFDTIESQTGRRWLEGYDGRRGLCRTDAEALVESLNAMPTGKGMWLRCLEIDKTATYNSWCRGWSARIWWQNGIGLEKLVDHDGNAKDFIDPYPLSHYYHDGRQFRPIEHQEVRGARIEGDVLVLDLPSGEWAAEIRGDEEVRRYDRHPYDPSFDLEHLAIECYRNKLPEEMFAWREHYVYGTPALRPFSRTMSEEEAKKADLMGRIPGILEPNLVFTQVCECAERLGIRLRLSHDVPALENLSMHPNERTCRSCLRRGCSNWSESNPCWEKDQCGGCFGGYMWDRRTPSKSRAYYRRGPPSKKRFNSAPRSSSMDKSMIPILVALVAIVAAGAALALHGGGTEDGREPPSGYPPGLDGPEKEKIDPIDPENEELVGSIWMSGPEGPVDRGDDIIIIVSVFNIGLGDVEVSLSEPFNYEFYDSEFEPRKTKIVIYTTREWSSDLIVTAKAGDVSSSIAVVPVIPPADVPSVSGASPAMEFYLELAPGGSEAIDVPSEYLSLLSMAQWSSSDPSVCTVTADSEAGTVTAVAHRAGECDLTASLEFYSAVCHVTVGRSN